MRSPPCALQNVKAASLASQRHAKPQVVAAKNVSGHCSMSSGGETAPVRNQWSRTISKKGNSQNSQEVALQDGKGLLEPLFWAPPPIYNSKLTTEKSFLAQLAVRRCFKAQEGMLAWQSSH